MRYVINSHDLSRVRLSETDRVASVLQQISVLLSTPRGSVPLFRNFGLDMAFLDRPANVGIPMMVAAVTEAMGEFIGGAKLISVTPHMDEAVPGKISPVVEVEISDE